MPHYPDIASPCPIADRLSEQMDGDFCRRCRKTVADLDTLPDSARYRLLADAESELCVRYRVPGRAALAAALAAGCRATCGCAGGALGSARRGGRG